MNNYANKMSNIKYLDIYSNKTDKQLITMQLDNLLNTFGIIDFEDCIVMRHLENLYLTFNPNIVKFVLQENYSGKIKNYKQAISKKAN